MAQRSCNFEPVYPGDTVPDKTFFSDTRPFKTLEDSLLNQPAQPTAKIPAKLQFYGNSLRDRPGYVSPPRKRPALAEQDSFKKPRCWHPSDDDLTIYGRNIAPETRKPQDDTEIASRGRPPSYMQQVSQERHQNSDRDQAMHGYALQDSRLGETYSRGGGRAVMQPQFDLGLQPALGLQTSSTTGTGSAVTTCLSPQTQQEVETLQIMSEVNPQGFEAISRQLDRARDHSIQHVCKFCIFLFLVCFALQ